MKIGTVFLVFFLSATILFSSLRVSITYAHLYLDPVGFIEKLCENQDKPELQCNGKCHLKKIVVESTNNDKTPVTKIDIKELLLFVSKRPMYSFEILCERGSQINYYCDLYTFDAYKDLDPPPQV